MPINTLRIRRGFGPSSHGPRRKTADQSSRRFYISDLTNDDVRGCKTFQFRRNTAVNVESLLRSRSSVRPSARRPSGSASIAARTCLLAAFLAPPPPPFFLLCHCTLYRCRVLPGQSPAILGLREQLLQVTIFGSSTLLWAFRPFASQTLPLSPPF